MVNGIEINDEVKRTTRFKYAEKYQTDSIIIYNENSSISHLLDKFIEMHVRPNSGAGGNTEHHNVVMLSLKHIQEHLIEGVSNSFEATDNGTNNTLNINFESIRPYFANYRKLFKKIKNAWKLKLKSN